VSGSLLCAESVVAATAELACGAGWAEEDEFGVFIVVVEVDEVREPAAGVTHRLALARATLS
jgi:hypothetical protein